MLPCGGFFLRCLQKNNEQFAALFDKRDENEGSNGDGSDGGVDAFTKYFGWLYNAKMVADFENIKVSEVWDLGVIQFLNDLTYIKLKQQKDIADANKHK